MISTARAAACSIIEFLGTRLLVKSNTRRVDRRTMMRTGKFFLALALSLCGVVSTHAQTIDEIYKKALTEGGTLNFYGTLAQINAEIILPAFEKRFPGIKVNHVDATADQLAARVIAEARGGRVLADIFQTLLDGLVH